MIVKKEMIEIRLSLGNGNVKYCYIESTSPLFTKPGAKS